MHKTRLVGDHQRLTFDIMKLFDTVQHRGPTGPSKLPSKGADSRFAK